MNGEDTATDPRDLSDDEWRAKLSPHAFYVLRHGGTDPPFQGEYTDTEERGEYRCAGCDALLFRSREKYHSGCGWPAFRLPSGAAAVIEREDTSLGMRRVEVLCANCEGHLGHLFDDGPPPEGLRYCINSSSMVLRREDEDTQGGTDY